VAGNDFTRFFLFSEKKGMTEGRGGRYNSIILLCQWFVVRHFNAIGLHGRVPRAGRDGA